ncbi:MAG: hypothetical protein ABSC14_05155 [Desulfomonilia bacterium]|jgi:hypothetical protein
MAWILSICTILGGISAIWYFWDKISFQFVRKAKSLPKLSMNRQMAEEVGLEQRLNSEGYRMFWGNENELEYYLLFKDYELINWTDQIGKEWQLTSQPGGQVPLKTKYFPEEISKRRESRKTQHK